jgi:hyperosmotically inducible protein
MKKRFLFLILLVFVTIGAALSPATAAPNPQVQSGKLIRQIRHELVTLPYYGVFDWLQFDVSGDNTVTLLGQVVRASTKSDAEREVKDIDGVRGVINRIEVLPLSGQDDRLRMGVYRAIYGSNSPLFHYATQSVPPIHIIVSRGRVTLKGVVANRGDATQAFARARGVSGSFGVTNELVIESEQPG